MKALLLVPAFLLGMCGPRPGTEPKPVTIGFGDFPQNVATIDLGQTITGDVTTRNDDGAGVTWSCVGDACAPFLKTTPTRATFKASHITGTAVLMATSKKQPSVSGSLRIRVLLNESPDQVCE